MCVNTYIYVRTLAQVPILCTTTASYIYIYTATITPAPPRTFRYDDNFGDMYAAPPPSPSPTRMPSPSGGCGGIFSLWSIYTCAAVGCILFGNTGYPHAYIYKSHDTQPRRYFVFNTIICTKYTQSYIFVL